MIHAIESVCNRLVGKLEVSLAPKQRYFSWPPVFIIGASRSGSTLLHQVLINAFRFGYFSNLHRWFYVAPFLLQRYFGWALPETREVPYESQLGYTKGLMSPSECDPFWHRWFRRRPQYVPIEEADLGKLASLRQVLIGLTEAFRAPLLLRSMLGGLRLRPLAALLPEARFLVIRRNPIWVGQSLLLVRERVNGHKDGWWALEPPRIAEIRRQPPERQVIMQVYDIYHTIERDQEAIGRERFLTIHYESLCRDVHGTLAAIQDFLQQDGLRLAPRFEVPRLLPIKEEIRLPREEFERLVGCAKEFFPSSHSPMGRPESCAGESATPGM